MLRGRRLPLPQSPLSRWRTTAPAPRLRRAPATASFFSTTAIPRNEIVHDERPTAELDREPGEAKKKSRLRVHKIGVYGDDWALLQEKRSAQPTTQHVRLSLQGINPFGDRNPSGDRRSEYEQHDAAMNARRRRRMAPQPHDPPQEAKKAEDYHFRTNWPRPNDFQAVERQVAELASRHPRHRAPGLRDVPEEAKGAGDYYFVSLKPHDNKRRVIEPGKGITVRRLWGCDDAPNEVAREHHRHPLPRDLQLQDEPQKARQETPQTLRSAAKDELHEQQLSHESPRSTEGRAGVSTDKVQGTIAPKPERQDFGGFRAEADQPEGVTDHRAGLGSRIETSQGKEVIVRQYKLVASEWKSSFDLGLSRAPVDPSLPVQHQAKPFDTDQYSEVPVAAADIGPAESFQRSFTEDPVLLKAKSLARMFPASSQSLSQLAFHRGPRFRLVPSWKPTPGKIAKSPQSSEDKPKTLESHMSELQIKDETKSQPEQPHESPVNLSGPSQSKAEGTNLEGSKAADDSELKAAQDESQVELQDAPASEGKGSGTGDEGNSLVEPIESPAPDNRSIFEKLFADQEREKAADYGQLSSKLKSTFSAAKRAKPSTLNPQNVPDLTPRDGLDPKHGLSIFRQLFPEQDESETAKSEQEAPRATHDLLPPPEDSVMVSLRNQVRNWLSEEDQTSWPRPGDHGSHSTVVVISGTSPSLMDTDFYRIAPEGQHVEGWAGGLVKVIQARDSISYEPLGQYYLMFHSRPPALAYVNEVRRLHELSRKLLHAPADSGREVAKGPLDQAPASPQPFLTDEERAAVRSFTLCSPHVTPAISVRMWNTELVKELAAKSNIADILPTLRPEASTPARVLLKLTSPDGQHGEGQGGLTADELWLTLRDDGRERSAPWMLASLSEGIMPVKPRFISEHYKITVKAEPVPLPLELDADDADTLYGEEHGGGPVAGPPPPPPSRKDGDAGARGVGDRNERFRRFVLTFTQPAIARRFVRCWHKRVVYDAVLDRSVVVDVTAIM